MWIGIHGEERDVRVGLSEWVRVDFCWECKLANSGCHAICANNGIESLNLVGIGKLGRD
jgi:hypothetical protein